MRKKALTSSPFGVGRFGLHSPFWGFSLWPGLRPLPPIPLRDSGVTGIIEVLFDVAVIKMFRAAMRSALNTLFVVVHLNSPRYTLIPQPSPCHEHLDEVPEVRAVIDHLDYWERAINAGEYWRDGLRDVTPSHVDEYYFLCPECGRIPFNDIEERTRRSF